MIESLTIRKFLHTLCLSVASGCATIVSQSDYDVTVECSSPGAMVNIYKDGELVTSTVAPSVVTLSSKGGYFKPAFYRFEFTKNGYKDEVDLRAGFDWWYVGNAVLPLGYLFALFVDPVTGAMWKFEKDVSVFGYVQEKEQKHIQSSPQNSGTKTNLIPTVARPTELPTNTASNTPPQMIEIDSLTL